MNTERFDRLTLFTCAMGIILCVSLIADQILTAKEGAYQACLDANTAASDPSKFCK